MKRAGRTLRAGLQQTSNLLLGRLTYMSSVHCGKTHLPKTWTCCGRLIKIPDYRKKDLDICCGEGHADVPRGSRTL